jgi:hypothetical protein
MDDIEEVFDSIIDEMLKYDDFTSYGSYNSGKETFQIKKQIFEEDVENEVEEIKKYEFIICENIGKIIAKTMFRWQTISGEDYSNLWLDLIKIKAYFIYKKSL